MSHTKFNQLLLIIGILLVGWAIVSNGLQTYRILAQECVPQFLGLLRCSDIQVYHGAYDREFVPMVQNLIVQLNVNETLMTSANAPQIEYFTGHNTYAFWGQTTKEEMVRYMEKRNSRYLVVVRGSSDIPELRHLFDNDAEAQLHPEFIPVYYVNTSQKEIILFQRQNE